MFARDCMGRIQDGLAAIRTALFPLLMICLALSGPVRALDAASGQKERAHVPSGGKNAMAVPALERKTFPQGTFYALKVPVDSPFRVSPALSKTLAVVDSPHWKTLVKPSPVFLINGGFFDPGNSLSASFVFESGMLTGDPRINPQLVNNPSLTPYLPKIFNRSEFRVYLCRKASAPFQTRYDITTHQSPIPGDCLLQSSLGAGPALLPKLEDKQEGFVDDDASGKRIRDPIGVCQRNARSAVAITARGDVILAMGAQNPAEAKNSGFTLAEMASLLKARGAVKAMALDGGSSTALVYQGQPFFGKRGKEGGFVKRPVKSVLVVLPPQ